MIKGEGTRSKLLESKSLGPEERPFSISHVGMQQPQTTDWRERASQKRKMGKSECKAVFVAPRGENSPYLSARIACKHAARRAEKTESEKKCLVLTEGETLLNKSSVLSPP